MKGAWSSYPSPLGIWRSDMAIIRCPAEMADIIMLRTVAMITSTSFAQRANLRKLGDVCPSLNSYEKLGPGCYQPPKLIVDPTQSDAGFHANVVERRQSGFIQVSQHYCFERALLYGSHDWRTYHHKEKWTCECSCERTLSEASRHFQAKIGTQWACSTSLQTWASSTTPFLAGARLILRERRVVCSALTPVCEHLLRTHRSIPVV